MSKNILISLNTCRKIFIERDYSNGLVIKFDTTFPMPLEGIISKDDWNETIQTINNDFAIAEKVCFCSFVETIFGLLSCYVSRLFFSTQFEKQLIKIKNYIESQNEKVFLPAGIYLTDPVERGFRHIEISFILTGKSIPPTTADDISVKVETEEDSLDDVEEFDDIVDEPLPSMLSYSNTEIAALCTEDPHFHEQRECGELFKNGVDYFVFRTCSVAVEYLGFRIEVFSQLKNSLIAVGYALC